ncbi:MAG TPA: hypothetical protein VFC44_12635, partial [Candidatus Saccharimonadales bacterium]|nr:hypothetical protein [Candidatus Saccharimonadales bacterium]
VADLTAKSQSLQSAINDRDKLKKDADQMELLAGNRFYWIKLLTDLRSVLMRAEATTKASLTNPENNGTNTDAGVWVETFSPVLPNGSPFAAAGESAGGGGGFSSPGRYPYGGRYGMGDRYGYGRRGMREPAGPSAMPTAPMVVTGANDISALTLMCRGVNREALSPNANSDLAYAVLQNLTNSAYFADKSAAGEKSTLGDMKKDENTNTFTFTLTVQLKHPFKL